MCPKLRLGQFILLGSLIACSGQSDSTRHRFREVLERGIPTAITSGGPAYHEDLFDYELLFTLNQDDNIPESLLTNPSLFLRSTDGRFYVMDISQRRIAVFNSDGNSIGSFGGPGSGPGEFNSALVLGIYGGSVNIYNRPMRRIERFSLEGDLIESVPSPNRNWVGRYFHYDTEEDVFIHMDFTGKLPEPVRVRTKIWSASGDSIAVVESDPVRMNAPYRGSTGPPWPAIPYRPQPLWYYQAGRGILLSQSITPVLKWYDFNGQLIYQVRIEGISNEMTEEARAHFKDEWNWRMETTPRMTDYAKRMRDGLVLPEHLPFWTYVAVDDAGFYWLRVCEEIDDMEAPRQGYLYRILSPEGEYLGTTRTPLDHWVDSAQQVITPISISQGRLMCISTDEETDGDQLCVYMITPAVRGLRYP